MLGVPTAADLNGVGADAGVVGRLPHNRFKEVRLGTLVTYIRAARKRPNLAIRAGHLVGRVFFDGGRAKGVAWLGPEGHGESLADLVVIAGGVYNTPAILQRSGIGDAALLQRAGVQVVRHLPAVGRNLTDHPGVRVLLSEPTGIAATAGRMLATMWRGPADAAGEPWWQHIPSRSTRRRAFAASGLSSAGRSRPERWRSSATIRASCRSSIMTISPRQATSPASPMRGRPTGRCSRRRPSAAPTPASSIRIRRTSAPISTPISARRTTRAAPAGWAPIPTTAVVDPRLRVHGIDGLMVVDFERLPRHDHAQHQPRLLRARRGRRRHDRRPPLTERFRDRGSWRRSTRRGCRGAPAGTARHGPGSVPGAAPG